MKTTQHPSARRLIFALFTATLLLTACSKFSTIQEKTEPPMPPLVTTQWLSEHLNDSDLVVLDSSVIVNMNKGKMTNISGKARFEEEHIPNAGFADLKGALSGHQNDLDFLMPSPEKFATEIGKLGIDNDTRVVVYSTDYHVWATRMWWMLKWAGLEQVAVLDGGFAAWKAEGRPISTEPYKRTPTKFKLALKPELVADRNEVLAAIDNEKVNIVDALPIASYNGKFSMYARPGHITTATSMPTSDLVNETGHFKSFDELDMKQEEDRSERIITYCGGGVAATGSAFTLYRLGFKDVAVYMGSLQEWAPNPENPMTTETNE